jgi:TRAP-type C4-dicarboxylate transport system permease small subunit
MKILRFIVKVGEYGAALTLFALMMLTSANIIGRSFFHFPVKATIEIGGYMLLIIVALGLGAAAVEGRHIKVDLVMDRLPKKTQLVIDTAMSLLSFVMLAITTWVMAQSAMAPTRYTAAVRIPDTPFKWVFAAGWGLCCIGALVVTIENFRKRGKDES